MRCNTLANILAACVNTPGTTSACSTLFTNALPGGTTGTQPTDTATAAIDIAHNPAANITALYGLATANPPFSPALSAQPNAASGRGLPLTLRTGTNRHLPSIAIYFF